jgi:SulP family sulfate permease
MVRTQLPVLELFKSTGFIDVLGEDHFLDYGTAISHLFNCILDPAVCIYECEARVFKECQNLPRPGKLPDEVRMPLAIPSHPVATISSLALWQELHQEKPPVVIDVREPREFHQGHIPQAESIPLFRLIQDPSQIPQIRPAVLVCRSGRRSTRAIFMLNQKGFSNLRILEGGMLAWENAGLLDAVDI